MVSTPWMASSAASRNKAKLISFAAKRPLATSGTSNVVVASTGNLPKPSQITFNRKELNAILNVYSFMVAGGEWRDYAMSFLREVAVFSIFRRAAETPLYRIEKRPALRNRQGMYAVIGPQGQVLKRGGDLRVVLRELDRKLIRSVD